MTEGALGPHSGQVHNSFRLPSPSPPDAVLLKLSLSLPFFLECLLVSVDWSIACSRRSNSFPINQAPRLPPLLAFPPLRQRIFRLLPKTTHRVSRNFIVRQ